MSKKPVVNTVKLPQFGRAVGETLREFKSSTKDLVEDSDTKRKKKSKRKNKGKASIFVNSKMMLLFMFL